MSKGDIRTAVRYTKRWSISLFIKEMQIKTTVRHHLTPIRVATIKKKTPKIANAGDDAGKLKPSCTDRGNVKWGDHYRKQ